VRLPYAPAGLVRERFPAMGDRLRLLRFLKPKRYLLAQNYFI